MTTDSDIKALLELEESDLLELIGHDLIGAEKSALPKDRQQLIRRANEWFFDRLQPIKDAVCANSQVRSLYGENDTTPLILAVADLIGGLCIGVSATTVAYLLVKRGVGLLCLEQWKSGVKRS